MCRYEGSQISQAARLMPPYWRRSDLAGLQFARLRMHTRGAADGLAGGTSGMRRTAMVLVGLLLFCWRLPRGSNYVAAVGLKGVKAARTVAAGRQCGRMPAAGDRVGGVHREVAEAPDESPDERGVPLALRSLFGPGGESSDPDHEADR